MRTRSTYENILFLSQPTYLIRFIAGSLGLSVASAFFTRGLNLFSQLPRRHSKTLNKHIPISILPISRIFEKYPFLYQLSFGRKKKPDYSDVHRDTSVLATISPLGGPHSSRDCLGISLFALSVTCFLT